MSIRASLAMALSSTRSLSDARVGELRGEDARLLQRVQVIADLDRPTADTPVGVRLLEMTTRVVDDVPVHAALFDAPRG
jgi:hypothetical protein